VEALIGILMACVSQVEGEHRGCEWGVPQGALDEPRLDARVQQMRGVGMAQGRDGDAHGGHPGPVCGGTAGALDPRATHGRGRRRTVGVSAPSGGKEPGGVTRGLPGGAEERQGIGGSGDGAIFRALPAVDLDLETRAIKVGDLREESCMEPEAHARDRGAGDLVVQGGGGREEPLDLRHTEDGGETVRGWRTQECEGVPITLEDVLREEADAAGAEAHGRWSPAIDVLAVEAGALQCRCRDAVGGWVGELSQEADFADISFLGPVALAAALESRHHVLTQCSHEMSPFVR
jgi:hypothetical protein